MSPKNKGKFGKGKSEVPETDEFVSGMAKLGERLKPHALRLGVLITAIAVVLVTYSVWHWYGKRKEAHATEIYAKVMELSETPVGEGTEEEPAQTITNDQGRITQFGSEAERAQAVIDKIDELRSEFASTGPATEAGMILAAQYLALDRYDDAADEYSKYASKGASPTLRLLALEGVGYALEAKAVAMEDATAREQGLEQALQAFENMQPEEKGPKRADALYHQARILTVLNRRDEAVAMLKKVLEANPSTSLKTDVENRLALLEAG